MENLIVYERPELRNPILIAGFYGWPDAAGISSSAIGYLIGKLKAKKFAEIDPEEFYVFTQNRPQTRIENGIVEEITFPKGEFYFYRDEKDLILFLGQEPDLKWRKYIETILDFISQWKVKTIYTLGGAYAPVPHTREPRISIVTNRKDLVEKSEILGINYRGETSIQTHFSPISRERGIECLSLWGDAPIYLRGIPNFRVALAILEKLKNLARLDLDLKEMEQKAKDFDEKTKELTDQISLQRPEFQIYLRKLEEIYDQGKRVIEPSAEELIRSVEEFLRQQKKEF